MPSTPSPLRVVVLTENSQIAKQAARGQSDARVTLVKDTQALQHALASQPVHGVVLECNGSTRERLRTLDGNIDLSEVFVLAGPVSSIDAVNRFVQWVGEDTTSSSPTENINLGDYVEAKFGEFVRAMKLGSAQDLYPTFMRAVERPLITLALQETQGNQMQAARLLGMNRNTLRKKIAEFDISIARCKTVRAKRSSARTPADDSTTR